MGERTHSGAGPRPLACVDCDYVQRRPGDYFADIVCTHPQAAVIVGDHIRGYGTRSWRDAEEMREDGAPCGPAGTLWLPRRSAIRRWLDWAGDLRRG